MELLDSIVYQNVSEFFKALGDATRVKIIWVLEKEELSVNEIAECLNMTQSAVSHQLATLRKANLVSYHKKGKEVFYYLVDDHVKQMLFAGLEHVHE